ncbi:DxFTY motif-containing membrane protein [Williamsoniiplasma lucivorax]|uniref:Uncharacterized protein n=1 Tax=Williamsoniiplasma lucivorax TaxID=209274 RepID=A0A2S5RDX4_9MOLU|nr:hypothetical protein [Williamsoniiplasma lucivorax]PPE05504.1 hypothetical protein ELUCI_v1c05970 [Williamsoniiplasma lucivorax]
MSESKQKVNTIRSFNLSRTNFWISALFQLLFAIVPFLFIWFFLLADFKNLSLNIYHWIPEPKLGYLVLICLGYILLALLLTLITWIFKWQKADGFTFVVGLTFLLSSIIVNQTWLDAWQFDKTIIKLLIRFILAIMFGLLGIVLGLFISTFARNFEYKQEDKQNAILEAYQENQLGDKTTWPRKTQKIIQAFEKKQIQAKSIQEKQAILNEKLINYHDQHYLKMQNKKTKTNQKLNAKEAKQRNKAK